MYKTHSDSEIRPDKISSMPQIRQKYQFMNEYFLRLKRSFKVHFIILVFFSIDFFFFIEDKMPAFVELHLQP